MWVQAFLPAQQTVIWIVVTVNVTTRQRPTRPSWGQSSWVLPQRDYVASLASVSWSPVEPERQRSARVLQKAVSRGCSPHRRLRAMYHSVCIACIPCCDESSPGCCSSPSKAELTHMENGEIIMASFIMCSRHILPFLFPDLPRVYSRKESPSNFLPFQLVFQSSYISAFRSFLLPST